MDFKITNSIITKTLRIIVPALDFCINIFENPNLIHKKNFIAQIFYKYITLTFLFVWIFSLIPNVGSTLYIAFMLIGGLIIFNSSSKRDSYSNTLFYYVIMNFGFLGIRSFVGHTFLADSVAQSIGWPTGSMFQIELAFYHLGLALATLSYIWFRSRELLFGIIIAKCTFLFGAMGVHVYEVLVSNNYNVGNIGFNIIYGDLILPLIVIYLFYKSLKPNSSI